MTGWKRGGVRGSRLYGWETGMAALQTGRGYVRCIKRQDTLFRGWAGKEKEAAASREA